MLMRLIFQMYQKTCSVCQGAINKDCVESSGRFYHSNCMKVFYLRSLTEKFISERNSIYCQAQGPTLGPTQGQVKVKVKVKVRTCSGHGQVRSNSNSNSN